MSEIQFSEEEKHHIRQKLTGYFAEEFDQDLSRFEADFLLDFVSRELGPFFYNRGLLDAQAVLNSKIDLIQDAVFELEKPIPGAR